ncbi:MAG: GGDEF domain-containing protein [Planctomycetota bacterium]|jgi:diguanylate cyclase (GGDEF)-like protein
MGPRSYILPAALYTFGLFAAFMVFYGSGVFDAPEGRSLSLQYMLVAMALGALVLIVFVRYALHVTERDLFFSRRYNETLQNRLDVRDEDATLLNRINELTEKFSETRNLEAVLHQAVSILKEVLHVRIIVLQLYSHEESKFFLRIEEGVQDLDLGEEVYEDVIEDGKSRLINNLESTGEYEDLTRRGYRSLLVSPLIRWGRGGAKQVIGLAAVVSEEQRDFTAHDQHLLNAFTKQAGMIIENAQLYEKTQQMAIRDGLTNLFNYRRFKEVLDQELEKCETEKRALSLLMADIDYFKNYNDTHGHQQGDQVLRTVADVVMRATRGADLVARYGGEEFVVILPDTEMEGARAVGENIRRLISEEPIPGEGESQPGGDLTITLGLASYPVDALSGTDLIEAADKALYSGKHAGRNRLIVYREMEGSG